MAKEKHYYTQSFTRRTADGHALTVMAHADIADTIADATQSVLNKALHLLRIADAALRGMQSPSQAMLAAAAKYFLTPADSIPADTMAIIRNVIAQTLEGLSHDVWIKTAPNIKKAEATVEGRVRLSPIENKYFEPLERNPPPGHHTFRRVAYVDDTDVFLKKNMGRSWGAIHIRADLMSDLRKGPFTLIHEGTHKYAGTIDYVYFQEKGRTDSLLKTIDHFDKPELAVWNADSYAWFICDLFDRPAAAAPNP